MFEVVPLTLSPIAEYLSDFRIDFGGEGTCQRDAISVPNNIGLGMTYFWLSSERKLATRSASL